VPGETIKYGDLTAEVRREISSDQRFVQKIISLADGRCFHERVRLLGPADLERMIVAHGAKITGRYGDYAGTPLPAGNRTILTAQVPS
jgi:hypothetical protein